MGNRIGWHSSQRFHSETPNRGIIYLELLSSLQLHYISIVILCTKLLHLPNFLLIVLFYGLTLIELATHLEEKAARLKREGLGKIKITLIGCNTSSVLDTLEGAFGSIDQETVSIASISEAKEMVIEDIPSIPSTPSPAESGPVGVELVLPTQAIPFVIAGIPESLLPIHGPEAQSFYRCQFTDCTQIFLQKAAACTHVCHDHLNVASACLYCSGRYDPKMQWFSALAWEKHVCKHLQDGLPLFPNDPAFIQLSPETLASTSDFTSESLFLELILERAKVAKQCLKEESKASTSLKHEIKQGTIKKSKKQKDE